MTRCLVAGSCLAVAALAPLVGIALPAIAPAGALTTRGTDPSPVTKGRPVTVAVSMVGVADAVLAQRRDRRLEHAHSHVSSLTA